MTAEIINLNRVRKARERQADVELAAQNRVVHGRTREERDQAAADEARRLRTLDGAEREREDQAGAPQAGGDEALDPGAVS